MSGSRNNWIFSGVIVLILLGYLLTSSIGAPALTYVYSGSMEPSIQVNDGFFVLPSFNYQIGDIIVFRPAVLDAELVTHRITAIGADGYITKGDNLSYNDQENGEPEVPESRIVGTVWEINDRPITVRNMGNLIKWIEEHQFQVRTMGVVLVVLGIVWSFVSGSMDGMYQRGKHKRRRLKSVTRKTILFVSIGSFILLSSIAKVEDINYLISQNPSTEDQFPVNTPGKVIYTVRNLSFFPVWFFPETGAPLYVEQIPTVIPPFGSEKMMLHIPPHQKTGWRKAPLYTYVYPAILPRKLVGMFQAVHPALSAMVTSAALAALLLMFSRLLYYLLEINPDTPLKALNYKGNRQLVKWFRKQLNVSARRK